MWVVVGRGHASKVEANDNDNDEEDDGTDKGEDKGTTAVQGTRFPFRSTKHQKMRKRVVLEYTFFAMVIMSLDFRPTILFLLVLAVN
jgi:hypothetical protein